MYKPDLYTTANGLQRRDGKDICKEYCNEIGTMSGRCIDIGSGPGDVVVDFVLPKLHPQATILCTDISESMVQFGKKRYKNNKRISFAQLDIETPNLPTDLMEQFDHVTSFYCLNWCKDMLQVFKNILLLLQPGGTALLSFLSYNPALNAYKILAAMPCYQPYMKDVDRYIPVFHHDYQQCKALKALIKDTGFNIHHYSCREKNYIFDTPDALREFMLAVNPFIERMPDALKMKYKQDLLREVIKQKIIINKDTNNVNEYSILSKYYLFVVYLEKPISLNDSTT